jgi:hypothetical protein
LFFLAGSRGLAAMNYQSLCNRLHVIAMRLEDESVDLEILPPLEAQKCLKTATWRDGMGRNCLKGMCWYITNFQLYIYIIIWLYVCMIYVGLRKSLHETTIYTYIYIYLDVPEGLVDFCPLAQICLFIQEAFFWLLERCIITDVFSRFDASFLLKFEDVSGQGWIIN